MAAANGYSEVVKLLLEAGADKDAAQQNGRTALHVAARKGCFKVVKLLLGAGADADVKDSNHKFPLDLAHGEVAHLLQPKPETQKRQKLTRWTLDVEAC